MEHRKHRDEP